MKIAIIGTGGVGGYFGARLLEAGYDVSFLARGEHLHAMRTKGLTIKSMYGDFQTAPCKASDKISDLGVCDIVIVAVKAWQIKEIRTELFSIMHNKTIVLPLQNGVMAAPELCETIDKQHVIGGLCRIVSMITAPGCVAHTGATPTIVFGELNNTLSDRLLPLQDIFNKSGIKNQLSGDIETELWKKFLLICISGLMAVTRCTYGEMNEVESTRQMMYQLLQEIYTLAQARGIKMEKDIIERTVQSFDALPYDTTFSLTRDVWEGKPSEIEYQNGTVVKLGKQYGIPTPVNEYIYNTLLPMERKTRKA
jgi:2-dehydropantoate 2-reductase